MYKIKTQRKKFNSKILPSFIKSNTESLQAKLFKEVLKFENSDQNFITSSQSRKKLDSLLLDLERNIDHRLKSNNPISKSGFILNNFFKLTDDKVFDIPISREKKFSLFYLLLSISDVISGMYDKSNFPLIIGLQGHQGCGKTTTTNIIQKILNNIYLLNVETISIDDLYYTHNELSEIKSNDPRYLYRGPPGTHDLNLTNAILNKVKTRQMNYDLPLYDKSMNNGLGDRGSQGKKIKRPIDVLLFEGWFQGIDPVSESEIDSFVLDNENNKYDADFLRKINKTLFEYKKLWDLWDLFLVLRPVEYELSKKWRIETEEKMIKSTGKGMNNKQINDFVDYFWRAVPPYLYFEKIEEKRKPYLSLVLDQERNIRY